MTARVHVAGALTPFKHLAQLIEDNRIRVIPIIDRQGMPIGVVSESDLQLDGEDRARTDHVTASDLMTSPAITVPNGAPVTDALRIMDQRNLSRLVVVDERGRIAGIVSRGDLLRP